MTQPLALTSILPGNLPISKESVERTKNALTFLTHDVGTDAITTIAEYAGKVDAPQMNIRYMQGIGIAPSLHKNFLEMLKLKPSGFACFTDGAQPRPDEIAKDAQTIANTPERTLLNLTWVLFLEALAAENPTVSRDELEKPTFDFFDLIEGIDRIPLPNGIIQEDGCINYAFDDQPWFHRLLDSDPDKLSQSLQSTPEIALSFLIDEQHYTRSTTPRKGQLTVYVRPDKACHFAIVESGGPLDQVLVRSKFGGHPLYIHKLGTTLYLYGQGYYLLDPPPPEAPSK